MFRKITAMYPKASALGFGFIFGVVHTYFLFLLMIPAIEESEICTGSAKASLMYCNLIFGVPLHSFVTALSSWIIIDWTKRWTPEYWAKEHDQVVGIMCLVVVASAITYAILHILN